MCGEIKASKWLVYVLNMPNMRRSRSSGSLSSIASSASSASNASSASGSSIVETEPCPGFVSQLKAGAQMRQSEHHRFRLDCSKFRDRRKPILL